METTQPEPAEQGTHGIEKRKTDDATGDAEGNCCHDEQRVSPVAEYRDQ